MGLKGKYQVDDQGRVVKRNNLSEEIMLRLYYNGFSKVGSIWFFDLETFNPKQDLDSYILDLYKLCKKEALNEYIKVL